MIRVTDPAEADRRLEIGEPETDPVLVAQLRAAFDGYAENLAWYEAHAQDVRRDHPGKYVAVLAGEVYAADDPPGLYARLRAARPGDWNRAFTAYIRPHPAA